MFVEPEVTESKVTAKADPSAPARSAIRRQRTVRYSPHIRNRPASSRTQSISNTRDVDRHSLLEAIRRGDSAVASTRANEDELVDVEMEADLAHAEASQRRRLESGRALLRDALSYERPGRRIRPHNHHHHHHHHPHHHHRPPMQASANSRHLGFTVQGLPYYSDSRSGSTIANIDGSSPQPVATEVRSPPPEYMPTPPYTSGNASNQSTTSNTTPTLGTASFTPRFAPAHRYTETAEAAFREYVARHNLDVPTDQDLDGLPPLRRMANRDRPRYSGQRISPHRYAVDGLGDRRRSFSPEDDSWETLLTTITPDDRLPSVNSSFTSATASASSLSLDSASSYGTLATVPSSAETPDAYPTICDNSDSDDSDSDDVDYVATERRFLDPSEDDISVAANLRHRVRMRALEFDRAEQLVRQRRILEREEELRQTQANLDRLQRQGPEDWWATAGWERATGARPGRERL